jgi:hypothetical protein
MSAEVDVDEFDDLEQLPFREIERSKRKGKQGGRMHKSKLLREKRVLTYSDDTDSSVSGRAQWRWCDWRNWLRVSLLYAETFLVNKSSRRVGAPFLVFGLLFSSILEIMGQHFEYNFVLLLTLAAATLFPHFPRNSVRPQLVLSVTTLFSFGLDIFKLSTSPTTSTQREIMTFLLLTMLCKLAVFAGFLHNTQSAPRTRKYLDRRLRLFFPPFRVPHRIMRDIRGRCMALCGIHFFLSFAFGVLLLVLVVQFDYTLLLLSIHGATSIPIFLFVKSISSMCIALGLLYDTDLRLCLWHFGCLAFFTEYLRKYLAEQRLALLGWPLAFSYSGLRMYLLGFVKVLDVLWGGWGWYLLSTDYFEPRSHLETNLRVVLSLVVIVLFLSDVWCSVLFASIRWLRKRMKLLQEVNMLEASDDSEIDELELRESLDPFIAARQRKEERRELLRKKFIRDGYEKETSESGPQQQIKSQVLRKPSRADAIRIKGKKGQSTVSHNVVMPEPQPLTISSADDVWDVEEGQSFIQSPLTAELPSVTGSDSTNDDEFLLVDYNSNPMHDQDDTDGDDVIEV